MPLRIYNTINRREEIFEPIDPPDVKMYVCGITPYDDAHLGHGRAYVVFDVMRRYLHHLGYNVKYIQNITDIDDKIINRANELGISIQELTNKYIGSFFETMDLLNIKQADVYPRATEHIKEMVNVIGELVKKGFAYEVGGDVYFEVAKFKGYGKLSKRKLDDMEAGARVEVDKRKKSPLDFALWKSSKKNEPSWDSPWGFGRPGWHIECSTMSTKYLGDTFDIHGGGLDLIFPHHENEIAQAEAFTGKPFVKYWVHNGFVMVNKEKMSKSLGNFFTLKDIFKKFKPEIVRFFLLSTQYRHPINFSDEQLKDSAQALTKINEAVNDFQLYFDNAKEGKSQPDVKIPEYKDKFSNEMNSDLNTAGAIGVMFELINYTYEKTKKFEMSKQDMMLVLKLLSKIFGILGIMKRTEKLPEEIRELITKRDIARVKKDFKMSDKIRDELTSKGYIVKDTPSGTSVTPQIK